MTTRVYTISRVRTRRVEDGSKGLRSSKEKLAPDGRRSFLFSLFFNVESCARLCVCVRVISRKKCSSLSIMLLEAANRREEVFIKKTRGDFCSNYSVLTNPTTTLRNRQRMNVMGGGKRKSKNRKKRNYFSSSIVEKTLACESSRNSTPSIESKRRRRRKKERSIS